MILLPVGSSWRAPYTMAHRRPILQLAALTANGTLDQNFGPSHSGTVTTAFQSGFDTANGVAIQPDGKIVVAGSAQLDTYYTLAALAPYTSSGTLDQTFGPSPGFSPALIPGLIATNINYLGYSEFNSVAIEPNYEIVAAGDTDDVFGGGDFSTMVARYIGIAGQTVPTVTWANPASITYGTPLSASQLDATPSVTGNFQYTPAKGTILQAGAGQELFASFTPNNSTSYVSTTTAVDITVTKATPSLTINAVSATRQRQSPSRGICNLRGQRRQPDEPGAPHLQWLEYRAGQPGDLFCYSHVRR